MLVSKTSECNSVVLLANFCPDKDTSWLRREFVKLRREFGLKLRLSIEECDQQGGFIIGENRIVLNRNLSRNDSLLVLLHEICHATQHRAGLLADYWKSFDDMWGIEKAAIDFSIEEYEKRYLGKFGKYTLSTNLRGFYTYLWSCHVQSR